MKFRIKSALLALAGVGLLANPAMGAVTLEGGSLALAFYQVTGSGGGASVGPNTYIFDLGQASLYRENTAATYGANVSTINGGVGVPGDTNIASGLVSAFGANWATLGNIRWMVVGSSNTTGVALNGDTARAFYMSAPRDTEVQSTFPTLNGGTITGVAGAIKSFREGLVNSPSPGGGNPDGTVVPITALKSVDEYVDPTTAGLWFEVGQDPSQALANNTLGMGISGALDMFRVLHNTGTGVDPDAGYSSGNAVAGQGQYIGTMLLSSSGNLTIIPEPSSALLGVLGAAGVCFRRRRNA